MYIYIYIYIYKHIYIYIYTYIHTHMCVCVCVCLACVWMKKVVGKELEGRKAERTEGRCVLYIYIYIYVYVCVYIYIYIYLYIYMYTYMYVLHTHVCVCVCGCLGCVWGRQLKDGKKAVEGRKEGSWRVQGRPLKDLYLSRQQLQGWRWWRWWSRFHSPPRPRACFFRKVVAGKDMGGRNEDRTLRWRR